MANICHRYVVFLNLFRLHVWNCDRVTIDVTGISPVSIKEKTFSCHPSLVIPNSIKVKDICSYHLIQINTPTDCPDYRVFVSLESAIICRSKFQIHAAFKLFYLEDKNIYSSSNDTYKHGQKHVSQFNLIQSKCKLSERLKMAVENFKNTMWLWRTLATLTLMP